MKRTKILLLTAIASIGALGTLALTCGNTAFFLPVEGKSNQHHITFTSEDLVSHSFSEETWTYSFTVGNDTAIDDTYPLFSYEGEWGLGTGVYGGPDEVQFGVNDDIVYIPSVNYNVVYVCFSVLARANVDLESSRVHYTNSALAFPSVFYFQDYGNAEEAGYKYYYAELELYDSYGESFSISEIEFVFSC